MASREETGSAEAREGVVYLVGAGPGPANLLTIRAAGLIRGASSLLHDDLVSPEVLLLAAAECSLTNVGKRCGEKTITQQEINQRMVEHARAGHSVVRLKSGDPLLFGRAAEEIDALTQAGIPFEIVPGVSTGFAAAALAGLSLTGRITSSRVLFATRHLAEGSSKGLAGITPEVTLVLYMPGRDYQAIAAELMGNGWPGHTRCIVASSLGGTLERLENCLLAELPILERLPSPSLMLFVPPEQEIVR